MAYKKIAFIGAGNMSRSIIAGLIKAGYPASHIMATNPSLGKLTALADDFCIAVSQQNQQALLFADVVVLAVKPQMMAAMLGELMTHNVAYNEPLFISLAAGMTVARLSALLGGYPRIIRAMPNTPAQLGLGMSGLFAPAAASDSDKAIAELVLGAVGKTLWVAQEVDINGIIAAAGSAPAYFFLFMQAIEQQAQTLGFSAEQARLLVQQTALGAAAMVAQHPELSLRELREQVTSKGGTTAQAIAVFEQQGLMSMTGQAMTAAVKRAAEMESLF